MSPYLQNCATEGQFWYCKWHQTIERNVVDNTLSVVVTAFRKYIFQVVCYHTVCTKERVARPRSVVW